jgi:hypothetical protein
VSGAGGLDIMFASGVTGGTTGGFIATGMAGATGTAGMGVVRGTSGWAAPKLGAMVVRRSV